MELRVFEADLPLASGETLRGARLSVAVWGALNAAGDNLVLYPTRFGGAHEQNAFLVGPGRALDPERWCVVTPNMLGNGASSSPSNTEGPQGGAQFPQIDHRDNVAFQRMMLAEWFDAAPIALAVGWSMGAQQAYRWAVEEPARVRRLCAVCGATRTRAHNKTFLHSLLAALEADPRYGTGAPPSAGLRAVGRIYAGWAYSQKWVSEEQFQDPAYGGYADLDDWLERYWDALFTARDANNLTTMIRTWLAHDVSDGGELAAALSRVTAQTTVATATTDLYFTPADCAADAAMIPGARYRDIETDWGHMCGSGQSAADADRIDEIIRDLLAS